jgi:rSAM/selenodomain-associated transferase 1
LLEEKDSTQETLILFFKSAEAGRVKTRLARELAQDKTLEVYRSLVRDALKVGRQWQRGLPHRSFICWGAGDPSLWSDLDISCAKLQHGDDLGQRMDLAMREAFAHGAKKVAIMGCDTPSMKIDDIESAFAALDDKAERGACFGPCPDGGYYLMSCSSLPPCVFSDLPWSADDTLERLLRRLEGHGFKSSLLESKRDIDHLEDLKLLNYRQDLWEGSFT